MQFGPMYFHLLSWVAPQPLMVHCLGSGEMQTSIGRTHLLKVMGLSSFSSDTSFSLVRGLKSLWWMIFITLNTCTGGGDQQGARWRGSQLGVRGGGLLRYWAGGHLTCCEASKSTRSCFPATTFQNALLYLHTEDAHTVQAAIMFLLSYHVAT